MGKKLYSGANFVMLTMLSSVLLIDLMLRLFAFDQTYCSGTSGKGFAACKEEHAASLWLDIVKIVCMIRMMHYATSVME